jgi:hypothetical protein
MAHFRVVVVRSLALAAACSTWLVGACGFDGVGAAAPVGDDAGVIEAGGPTGSDANAVVDAGAVTIVDANFDIGTSKSCKEILARDPSTLGKTGAYTLDLYCEMALDGGGWTLVARSAKGGRGAFGWTSNAGAIADLTKPYSKDVVGAGLVFTEILIADRDPTTRAYKLPVPADFLTHANDRIRSTAVVTLLGDCAPLLAPTMLKYIGATGLTDTFFFRDIDDLGQHRGLHPDKWDLAYATCELGASLDDKQGFIFVR